MTTTRRQLLAAGLGLGAALVVPSVRATPEAMAAAVSAFTGGATPREGRLRFEISPLVENGNTVPITVAVDSPMTATDHVQAIAVFNERNPQTQVANFTLGPRAGRAVVGTRIRLATSQKLIAVARLSDGSHWSQSVDVIVTLAACVET